MKIDAHQHYWLFTEQEFGWLEGEYAKLRRDFSPTDVLPEMESLGYAKAVAVQARETLEENRFLLDLADRFEHVGGVVGWVELRSESCEVQLELAADDPKFKGVRMIAQGMPEGFFSDPSFLSGIGLLAKYRLTYDVLIYANQLAEATRLVRAFPCQRFALDHAAKPPIRNGDHAAWTRHIREMAEAENVYCKLSGLVTEADHAKWTDDSLRHYVEVVLDAFGPSRTMVGSDWPVCLAAASYESVMPAQERLVSDLSESEKSMVLGGTAAEFYGL